MICRIWHGWTRPEEADAYERLLREKVFPQIRSRGIRGFAEIDLLRRETETETEFATLMWFDTLEAVREFAGADVERAVVPPDALELLARFDDRSAHFAVLVRGPAHLARTYIAGTSPTH